PCEICGIRARRPRPGLAAQHRTALRAAAEVCGAALEGDELGSMRIRFTPRASRAGQYRWAVGTAGATTLVAQTVAVPLLRLSAPSRLRIQGGSHVAWAPSLDYLRDLYAPMLALVGWRLEARLVRYGFYPRGGGEIEVGIGGVGTCSRKSAADAQPNADHPSGGPARNGPARSGPSHPFLILERPPARAIRVTATAVVSSLPRGIGERMIATASGILSRGPWRFRSRIEQAHGPQGTYLFVRVDSGHDDVPAEPRQARAAASQAAFGGASAPGDARPLIAGGFTGLGARGKPAEAVAREASQEALAFLESEATLDRHLADQLLLPAALAGCALRFRTTRLTSHLRTNAETMALFLGPCVFTDRAGAVEVRPPQLDPSAGM
ncbi:MAG: hypothetical protein GF330_01235, partial [Candidatus Eisenbacteria bacterium]|nr:hypothetical protein [Candidatus Eisenbacteria bacterium]